MNAWWWNLKKAAAQLRPGLRRVERLGARWELDPRDPIDLAVLVGQPYEKRQLRHLGFLIDELEPDVLLDVGAGFGLYSILMALEDPDLAVEAFEPAPAARAKLERNIALNGLEGRVRVHPLALSDAAGSEEMAINRDSASLSPVSTRSARLADRGGLRSETVRTARLDDVFRAEGRIVAMKISVDRHEREALAGMTRLLNEARGVIQIEAPARYADSVRAMMSKAGWREGGWVERDFYYLKD